MSFIRDNNLIFASQTRNLKRNNERLSAVFKKLSNMLIFPTILILFSVIFSFAIVSGSSMNDTLQDQDYILVNKLTRDYDRNDVVIIKKDTEDFDIIKRVVGCPGDTVLIQNGKLYINGKISKSDTHGNSDMDYPGIANNPVKLGDGDYFVLGDNRNHSEDSRYEIVGVVKKEEIIGKAFLRLFPTTKWL